MTPDDLKGLSDQKLQFILENGDPSGMLVPLAKQVMASRQVTSVPPTGERKAKLDADIAKGMIKPETEGSYLGDIARGVGRQVVGSAGALAQTIPGLVPAAESAGELVHEVTRGHPTLQKVAGAVLPRPGDVEKTVQRAPLPIAARTLGMMTPMAAADRPRSMLSAPINAAMAPAAKLYRGAQQLGQKAGLGPTSSNLLAGGVTGGSVGLGDAAIRRIPDAALPNRSVAPVDWMEEVGGPAAGGMVFATPVALHAATTRTGYPDTAGAKVARDYVKVKTSKAEKNPESPLFGKARGQMGIDEVAQAGDERIGRAAARQEPEVRKISTQRNEQAKNDLAEERQAMREAATVRSGPRAGEQIRVDTEPLMATIDDIVMSKAKEGDPEIQLQLGEGLKKVKGYLEPYMQNGATLRDLLNAEQQIGLLAESGTPEKKFPFQEIAHAIKKFSYRTDPSQMAAQPGSPPTSLQESNRKFAERVGTVEDANRRVYGTEEANLAQDRPRARYGDPNAPAPNEIDPARALRGRTMLSGVGDKSKAGILKEPDVEWLKEHGYASPINEMAATRAGVDEANAQKWALEKSRFPNPLGLLHGGGQLAMAATMPASSHALGMGGMATANVLGRLGQWGQSGLALKLRGLEGRPGASGVAGGSSQTAEAKNKKYTKKVFDAIQAAKDAAEKLRQERQ